MQGGPLFLEQINQGLASPLSQLGLGLLSGSMSGDPGQGLQRGAAMAGNAAQSQMQQRRMMAAQQQKQREAQAAAAQGQQRQKLFLESLQGAGIDPKQAALYQNLSPEDGSKLLLKQLMEQQAAHQAASRPMSEMDKLNLELKRAQIEKAKAEATGAPGTKPPTGYMVDPNNPTRLQPIPGGPADAISGEQAARVGLLANTMSYLPEIRKLAIGSYQSDNNGNFVLPQAGEAPAMGMGPGSHIDFQLERGEIGELRRKMMVGVEGILRAQTGAAATPEEINRELSKYLPRPDDTIATRANKLKLFEDTLRRVIALSTKGLSASQLNDEISQRDQGAQRTAPGKSDTATGDRQRQFRVIGRVP